MYLECTCPDVTEEQWERLMNNAKRMSYRKLVSLVKKQLPDLYYALRLNYPNPYSTQCWQTDTHYILVHSAIEYFIRKDAKSECKK